MGLIEARRRPDFEIEVLIRRHVSNDRWETIVSFDVVLSSRAHHFLHCCTATLFDEVNGGLSFLDSMGVLLSGRRR